MHMQLLTDNLFYVYITTNEHRNKFYVGTTTSLPDKLHQLAYEIRQQVNNYAAKYGCAYLIYWEHFPDPMQAVLRESEIRDMSTKKKEALIENFNKEWRFLNEDFKKKINIFI